MGIDKSNGRWSQTGYIVLVTMAVAGCGQKTESNSVRKKDVTGAERAQSQTNTQSGTVGAVGAVKYSSVLENHAESNTAGEATVKPRSKGWPQFRGPDGLGHGDARISRSPGVNRRISPGKRRFRGKAGRLR